MRRFLFGLLWYFVIFGTSTVVVGFSLGMIEGITNNKIDMELVSSLLFLICIPITAYLSIKGKLPGTNPKSKDHDSLEEKAIIFEDTGEILFSAQLSHKKRGADNWNLFLHHDSLVFREVDGHLAFKVDKDNVSDKVRLPQIIFFPSTISYISGDVKYHFFILAEDAEKVREWAGKSQRLLFALKSQMQFLVPLGILIMLMSLPMAADTANNIKAVPFSPFDLVMGISLVILGLLSKYAPHKNVLLLDSIWFFILAAYYLYNIYIQKFHVGWFVFALYIIVFAYNQLTIYRKLE